MKTSLATFCLCCTMVLASSWNDEPRATAVSASISATVVGGCFVPDTPVECPGENLCRSLPCDQAGESCQQEAEFDQDEERAIQTRGGQIPERGYLGRTNQDFLCGTTRECNPDCEEIPLDPPVFRCLTLTNGFEWDMTLAGSYGNVETPIVDCDYILASRKVLPTKYAAVAAQGDCTLSTQLSNDLRFRR